MKVLLENKHVSFLAYIVDSYKKMLDAFSGVKSTVVTFAQKPSLTQLKEVAALIEYKFHFKTETHVLIDPNLIGGFTAKFGGILLDASVKNVMRHFKGGTSMIIAGH